jgi:hypothetical protein
VVVDPHHCLQPRDDPQFAQDVCHMVLHCLWHHAQRLGDGFVTQSLGQQPQHLLLPLGQALLARSYLLAPAPGAGVLLAAEEHLSPRCAAHDSTMVSGASSLTTKPAAPASTIAARYPSTSWAVSTSTAVSGQCARTQATVSAGRGPGNAWSSSSTCGRSSSISRSASPPGDCLSARSRNAYSAGPGYREGCLHA